MADIIYGLGYDTVRREGKFLLQKLSKDGTKRAEIWCYNGEKNLFRSTERVFAPYETFHG